MAQSEIQKVTAKELGNYSGAMSVVGYQEEPQYIPHALDYKYVPKVPKGSSNGAEVSKIAQPQEVSK